MHVYCSFQCCVRWYSHDVAFITRYDVSFGALSDVTCIRVLVSVPCFWCCITNFTTTEKLIINDRRIVIWTISLMYSSSVESTPGSTVLCTRIQFLGCLYQCSYCCCCAVGSFERSCGTAVYYSDGRWYFVVVRNKIGDKFLLCIISIFLLRCFGYDSTRPAFLSVSNLTVSSNTLLSSMLTVDAVGAAVDDDDDDGFTFRPDYHECVRRR